MTTQNLNQNDVRTITGYVIRKFTKSVPDIENMIGEMLYQYHLASKVYDTRQYPNIKKHTYCWWIIKKRMIDYLRIHGKKNRGKVNPIMVYPDQNEWGWAFVEEFVTAPLTEETKMVIRRYIKKLSKKQEFLIIERYFNYKPVVRIAEELQLNADGLSQLHTRAIRNLKEMLTGKMSQQKEDRDGQ